MTVLTRYVIVSGMTMTYALVQMKCGLARIAQNGADFVEVSLHIFLSNKTLKR